MKKSILLNIDDYVYQFYQIGAETLGRPVEELMEQALYMYAGIVANDLNQSHENSIDTLTTS